METIHWRAMTPYQRNVLIAKKVMGRRIVKDEWVYWLVERTDGTGTEEIPRYSQNMDAAWLILQNMVQRRKTDERTFELFASYLFEAATQQLDESEYGAAWGDYILAAQWTPERICIAAMRAMGYDVLTEEVKP